MDGKIDGARLFHQDGLGAVAVVYVEVEHSNLLRAGGERFQRRNGNGVQVAKAHRVVAGRVMARRTHQTEGGFPEARELQCV